MKTLTLTVAAAAIAATGTIASASNSYFITERLFEDTSYVDLELVRSESDAVVEIRDYRLGEPGALLGSTDVNAGANHNLKINLGTRPLGDVIAVLVDDGQVLATKKIDIAK
jgi:hypothetical protein